MNINRMHLNALDSIIKYCMLDGRNLPNVIVNDLNILRGLHIECVKEARGTNTVEEHAKHNLADALASKANVATDDTIFPIGKHKGVRLADVPIQTLAWFADQDWFEEKYPAIYNYIIKAR